VLNCFTFSFVIDFELDNSLLKDSTICWANFGESIKIPSSKSLQKDLKSKLALVVNTYLSSTIKHFE
jgi:hypothetical protein